MPTRLDVTNKRFGKLVAINYVGSDSRYNAIWRFLCDCGRYKNMRISNVKYSKNPSCGCSIEKHGLSNHRMYTIWHGMVIRCHNKKSASYRFYGQRGIKVCPRWRKFKNFYDDMHGTYFDGAQIDRINSNCDYEFTNCQWVTPAQNIRNRSATKLNPEAVKVIKYFLKHTDKTCSQIAKAYGVTRANISHIKTGKSWKNITIDKE